MKLISNFLTVALASGLAFSASRARADLEVSAGVSIHAAADFDAPLTPYGEWVDVEGYGRCWHPAHVAVEWRPYCYGHWEWTDCGWYWVSDEPWAWACYHYGCWVYDPVRFWLWVPGIEWAPAWVSWRVGGGYIGWAPLAPAHLRLAVAAPPFVFVATDHFRDPVRPATVIVNNATILRQTKVIHNVTRETRTIGGSRQKVMINTGPGIEVVQKASGKRIDPVPIHEAARQTPAPRTLSRTARESRSRVEPNGNSGDRPKPPTEPTPPNRGSEKAPEHPGFAPTPERPPLPAAPPSKSYEGPRAPGGEGGRGPERENEGRGRDRP